MFEISDMQIKAIGPQVLFEATLWTTEDREYLLIEDVLKNECLSEFGLAGSNAMVEAKKILKDGSIVKKGSIFIIKIWLNNGRAILGLDELETSFEEAIKSINILLGVLEVRFRVSSKLKGQAFQTLIVKLSVSIGQVLSAFSALMLAVKTLGLNINGLDEVSQQRAGESGE